jgi:transposase
MPAEPSHLIQFIRNRFAGCDVTVAYEAGFSGFELYRELEAAGIKCLVVHAAAIEVSRERVKNDRRDAKKIASQLHGRRFKGIRVPSREEEARRVLHRTREQHCRKRRAIKNQIRMRFYQFGTRLTESKRNLTFAVVEAALKKEFLPEFRIGIESLVATWKALNSEIARLEKHLEALCEQDERMSVYLSVPGIGLITASVLCAELGDMTQFANERALFSFTGLTPQEYSSGEREHKGHISRQGGARIRHALIETAWAAVRTNSEIRRGFEKLAARAGKKRAIVATARKLVGRIRAMFQKKEFYRSQRALKRAA